MIIDTHDIEEYPFKGVFYTWGVDESKPPIEQVEEEIVKLETVCDIQGAQKEDSGVISNAYNVYFPFDKEKGININKGDFFRSNMYGFVINRAVVVDIVPTQLGGCAVYVKDNTSN